MLLLLLLAAYHTNGFVFRQVPVTTNTSHVSGSGGDPVSSSRVIGEDIRVSVTVSQHQSQQAS